MQRSAIKPNGVYAVTGTDRAVTPALALGSALWDRLPREGWVAYRPAPEDETWDTTLDRVTGARRGILVVQPPMGTRATKKLVQTLERLGRRAAKLGPLSSEEDVAAFEQAVPETLSLNVVRVSKVLSLWTKYESGERLHKCPACGNDVSLNAASRLRAHPDGNGVSCARSNTPLSKEERHREQ
ncbi:hypothetical protein [Streptomyces sp. NPDC056670]|uniref:hypothetical protein n=1 Tax=Streptomyces sp. NPDC056670 TaxID=3345904 RepID=UPI003682039C